MLEVRGVTFGYPVLAAAGTPAVPAAEGDAGTVLRGASLSVRPGERVALLGHNGSGKSTLLRVAAAGIAPTAGEVLRDGHSLAWDDASALMAHRREVGVVGQDPDDQMVATTVFEEVAFGPCNLGLPEAEVRRLVTEALERCRLAGLGARDVAMLSGGQRQRVALAGILAMCPRYLLLDEPCSMLDAAARCEVLAVVDEAARAGCGVLHVTHELADVIDYDRALVMSGGRVVWEGAPRALLLDEDACALSCCLVSDWLAMARELLRAGILPADAPLGDPRACGALAREAGACAQGGTPGGGESSGDRGTATPVVDGACQPPHPGKGEDGCLLARGVSFAYGESRGRGRKRRGASRQPQRQSASQPVPYAVREVNLELTPGGATLVSGPTGSGKSTLMRLLAGLIDPLEGSVCVGGATTSPAVVACSFQRAEDQLFADTVLEDVAFGPRNLGCVPAEADLRAREALERVGLDPEAFGARSPFCLSGGQMRRVALAGVLAMGTPFVALDEPTVGLDARGLDDLRTLLEGLRSRGVGVVIVSHDVERCLPLVDELVVLAEGRVALRCPSAQARRSPELLARAGLGLSARAAFERGLGSLACPDGQGDAGVGA